ncbi:hypothetical protein H2204_005769 [Knufia peltigerae]|uniref:Uncharacterized protein n=1 Tax=Knufia peltigerae TaxID=1002370 RepID=A0AA38Y4V7_9EURO|nr:hypothetical protein H2204_005769 [Knufia peltigerae]
MANWSSSVPAGILGGLAGLMIIFIWWWFPRTWRKGVKQENAQLDDVEIQAEREMVIQNARNIVDNYRETLKLRELAKNTKTQSTEIAVEEQPGMLEPAAEEEESALDQAGNVRTSSNPPRPGARSGSPTS